jgi:hypothetical protein
MKGLLSAGKFAWPWPSPASRLLILSFPFPFQVDYYSKKTVPYLNSSGGLLKLHFEYYILMILNYANRQKSLTIHLHNIFILETKNDFLLSVSCQHRHWDMVFMSTICLIHKTPNALKTDLRQKK